MPFPRKLLTPGEEVIVEAHPNWSILVRPVAIALVVVGGWAAIRVLWSSEPSVVGYLFAAIAVLGVLWLVSQLVAWRARLLVITTTRVVYRWGIIRRTGREIPLDRVQDVTYHQSFIERMVGAGSLTIESAGKSGQEPFPDVRHPAELQSVINQLITGDRDAWRRAAMMAQQAPPAPAASPAPRSEPTPAPVPPQPYAQPPYAQPYVPAPEDTSRLEPVAPRDVPPAALGGVLGEQLRDLERLHEAGVLTDDEFDRKRKQLLGLT
ncbi:MAG: PH domain-containing protein [Acidimicrobiales bacterium]